MNQSQILIIEDDPAVAQGLQAGLLREGFAVIWKSTGADGTAQAQKNPPHLVLLDIRLPDGSGFDFCRQMRQMGLHFPIIMLTARGDERDKVLGLETGADDYITKPFSPRELSARIKAVLRRRAPQMTEDRIALRGLMLDPVSHRVTGHGIALELGPTEFRLLHFFMTHPERVYSRTQLLDQVWGDHVFVEERTVDVHIRRLRLALGASGHEDLIATVRGAGYRLSVHD